ncbi:hypothetical protein ABIF72_007709 [Bradyrhizobium japonicum]
MLARDPADRLTSLQGLLNKSDLLVVTPSAPALGAQYLHLHLWYDLKASRPCEKPLRRIPMTGPLR